VALLALAVAVACGSAGCGGDEGGDDVDVWATAICRDVHEWMLEHDALVASIAGYLFDSDEVKLRAAVSRLGTATDELLADLERLGAPDVDAAARAQEELASIRSELRSQRAVAERALADAPSGVDEALSTIGYANRLAWDRLYRGVEALESLDPGGELGQAFARSEQCGTLRRHLDEKLSN
jgi:hypothetical protein